MFVSQKEISDSCDMVDEIQSKVNIVLFLLSSWDEVGRHEMIVQGIFHIVEDIEIDLKGLSKSLISGLDQHKSLSEQLSCNVAC
ncbi:MAG: hypothetical protein HQL65_19890 [Magnetococcales bacterium]|nr:hypothetical protein [Magnetococcales bacterium]